jgi:maltose alpha-D-glucosyltransferase/alpha-amylase
MQIALASRSDIADFAPEPASAGDLQLWRDSFNASVTRVFDALAQHRPSAKESDRKLIDALLHYRDDLPDLTASFLTEPQHILKARHHGDLHLGQLLIAKDDILIIDFEGEPRRSIDERRRKAPAARDIAGLLRSIDYAAGAALMRAHAAAPDDGGTLLADLDTWRSIAADTFLFAYRESLTDARLWPQDSLAAERLLKFFLLEKVFYEIEYELAHRPDWLGVPLDGALRILATETEVAE